MYEVVLKVHSLCAYVVVLSLFTSCVNSILGFFQKREYQPKDLRLHLFSLIFVHIQVLLGVILYFCSPFFSLWGGGMKSVMQNSEVRLFLVEHPVMMILSAVLITVGWSLHKKQKSSQRAFGKIALFYSLGLLAILFVIPWSRWF